MKWIKRLLRLLFSRFFVIACMILLQFGVILFAVSHFSGSFTWFYLLCFAISIVVVLIVVNRRDLNAAYKLAVSVPILLFPLFGGCVYLILYAGLLNRRVYRRFGDLKNLEAEQYGLVGDGRELYQSLPYEIRSQFTALQHITSYPVFDGTETRFYPLGEEMFPVMKEALENAKDYIYLEYFIVEFGTMWGEILGILQKKASEGVDVRLIYDGIGTVRRLPWGYEKHLEKMGIRCRVYNPLLPLTAAWQNIRDHRKILVVDGKIAFTGGINLTDEYINLRQNLGHWKDTGISVRGAAALSFAVMFRCLWKTIGNENEPILPPDEPIPAPVFDGLVVPYGDNPYANIPVGRDIYLGAITQARDSIQIMTPYFIVDDETLTTLKLAAARGVRITVITPHIGDKWYVHMVTRSYYAELLEAGIEVFEYSPGFLHAKNMITDGTVGICGSVNFDYRSFYLQLECGVMMYRTSAIAQMQEDFRQLLSVSRRVTDEDVRKVNWFVRILRSVLRIFAPVM